MNRVRRLAVALLCAWAVTPAAGDLADGLPDPDAAPDTTAVYASPAPNPILRARTLWRGLVYPLGVTTIWAEREEVPQQVHDAFTNDAGTFGIFPQVQLGGETGTGGGVRLFHTDLFGGDESLEILYILSAPGRQRGELLWRDPTVGGGGLFWEAFGSFLDTDHEDATVNGVVEGRRDLEDAIELIADIVGADDEVLFETRDVDLRLALGWRSNAGPLEDYRPGFTAEVRAGWARRELAARLPLASLPGAGLAGETSTPSASAVPGVGQSLSYAWTGVRLAWDDRDAAAPRAQLTHPLRFQFPGRVLVEHGGLYHSFRNLAYPEGGGLLEASFDGARGDDVEFTRLGLEAQRFQRLFWRERVLAARVRLDKVFPSVDGLAPYGDLPTLGGGQRLRGYKRGTYRGEGALLLAVEYRWPVWDTWNASLFWEEGQVFDDFGDLESDGFASSAGAALTLRSARAFLLSLRVAHSARANILLGFSLDQEF